MAQKPAASCQAAAADSGDGFLERAGLSELLIQILQVLGLKEVEWGLRVGSCGQIQEVEQVAGRVGGRFKGFGGLRSFGLSVLLKEGGYGLGFRGFGEFVSRQFGSLKPQTCTSIGMRKSILDTVSWHSHCIYTFMHTFSS